MKVLKFHRHASKTGYKFLFITLKGTGLDNALLIYFYSLKGTHSFLHYKVQDISK